MINELIQTTTKDNLILSGLLVEGGDKKTACIFIHGFTSDFYTHLFPIKIAETLKESGISTLLAQNRGTGIQTEILSSDRRDGHFYGSFFEKIEESHIDITAWIKYLKERGYNEFILIGHSLGTIKAVRYLSEGEYRNEISKLVLLAPFDKNWFIFDKAKEKRDEHLSVAKEKVKNGEGKQFVTPDMEDFLVSYDTYVSWYETDELSCMFDFYRYGEYDFPTLKNINVPVLVELGTEDKEFMKDISVVPTIFKENVKDIVFNFVEGSAHTFVGYEDILAKEVKEYILNQ